MTFQLVRIRWLVRHMARQVLAQSSPLAPKIPMSGYVGNVLDCYSEAMRGFTLPGSLYQVA